MTRFYFFIPNLDAANYHHAINLHYFISILLKWSARKGGGIVLLGTSMRMPLHARVGNLGSSLPLSVVNEQSWNNLALVWMPLETERISSSAILKPINLL